MQSIINDFLRGEISIAVRHNRYGPIFVTYESDHITIYKIGSPRRQPFASYPERSEVAAYYAKRFLTTLDKVL